jgi:carbamoyl-phosphate synthase large subunit
VKTILITGIGGDIAQGIATIVRETFPEWRIVGADVHERHGGALFVDALARAPFASDPHYDDWLRDVIAREGVDLCLPMSESELMHLARNTQATPLVAPLVMANPRAIDVGSDKLRTSEFLASIGVARPWTIPAETLAATTPLPCIFKARRGAGSKAVFVCNTPGEIEFYRGRYPAAVLQELLLPADREVTCAVFRSRGQTAVLQLLRTLVGGFTGWAQVIDDPAVTAQCRQVADGLDLHGSINVQLRITSEGPRIFEINPRFSSTVLIRHRMGFRDVAWSLQDVLGEPVQFHQPPAGTIAVRVQGAAVSAESSRGV